MLQGDHPCPIVSKDSIRLALHGKRYDVEREAEVHHLSRLMTKALFMSGHDIVVLDETHTTTRWRNACYSEDWHVRFKVFGTSETECLRRALSTGDTLIAGIIKEMSAQWEPLTVAEHKLVWKGHENESSS
jgi:hypothetical protein